MQKWDIYMDVTNLKKTTTVSVALVRILSVYADRLGVDFLSAAKAAGVDEGILSDGEARLADDQFNALWQRLTATDPFPGLSLGREMVRHYPGGSILFTMMMNCPDIGAALDILVRYHGIMVEAFQPRLLRENNRVCLTWDLGLSGSRIHPQISEALMSTVFSVLNTLSQDRISVVTVSFTHAGPKDRQVYRHLFKGPVIFGAQKNELVIDENALCLPIPLADRSMLDVLERRAERLANELGKPLSDRVSRLLHGMILQGRRPDIDTISKKLAIGRRSLQEKLKAERTSFRNCLEAVRREISLDYLCRPDTTICDVAFLVGYSEQSAFNHAFKRWTGKTPKDYCREEKINRRSNNSSDPVQARGGNR